MKISRNWLHEYLDRPATGDEIEHLMMNQGMPIETRAPVGTHDEMLDVEVTSNRSDCLCHVGVAREVAAGSGRTLKLPDFNLPAEAGPDVTTLTSVELDRFDLCPVYTARVIRGVKVGPSPKWLVDRLEAIGQRSVNNIVDVTNYVLFELGQPLHAFDFNRLGGRKIVVRTARPGETFIAIDGTKHTLATPACPEMLVIADSDKAVAIAGVMGGKETEVTSVTTDILLESAVFTPLTVRKTSRALKLASDSSYRYERGVNRPGVEAASRRAAALIIQLAGGALAPGVIRAGEPAAAPRQISLRISRIAHLLGLSIPTQEIVRLLAALGFAPALDATDVGECNTVTCTVPPHRLDIAREVDLIEEVARLHGLQQIPINEKIRIRARAVQPDVAARRRVRQTLVSHGYHETVTFSFVNPKNATVFVPVGEQAVVIDDERRKSEPMLRPSLLPSLLACRKSNQDVGNVGVRLFEVGATWCRVDGRIVERARLALVADAPEPGEGVRGLRGAIEELVQSLAGDKAVAIAPTAHPVYSSAASVTIDGHLVGVMGLVDAKVTKLFEIHTPVAAGELAIERLIALYPPTGLVKQLPRYPGIERDLSVVVDEAVTWGTIEAQIVDVDPDLLEKIDFLVTYRGKPIPQGKKSVSFRMLFRDPFTTLRHEQVDPQVAFVVERLKTAAGAELRA